jgi:pimeloyl-ACP methyl ester carboxylesterase
MDIPGQLLADIPMVERRLTLAGVTTSVLEGGEGPPVVLLHGPGAYAASWYRVLPRMLATHRVIAPDLPGQGRSVLPDGALDHDRVQAWLGELIERTCPRPPAIVGHLVGGTIAAHFASARPDAVGRLVLVVPLGLAPLEPAPAFGAALAGFTSLPSPATQDELWRQCVSDLDDLRGQLGRHWELIAAYNLMLAKTPSVAAAQATLMELYGFPAVPAEELAAITVPTSLVWGSHDPVVPIAVGKTAGARFGWPLEVIEGAGNEPALEAPEAFVRAVNRALEVGTRA